MAKKRVFGVVTVMVGLLLFMACMNTWAAHEGGVGKIRIDINNADNEQLMLVKGMTSGLARAIVKHREGVGFFKRPEDLMNVNRVNGELYEMLNPQVSAEGLIYCLADDDLDLDEDEIDLPFEPTKC